MDLESVNGTRIGPRRIPAGVPVPLGPGDLLRLGALRLVVALPADLCRDANRGRLRLPPDGVAARALVDILAASPALFGCFGTPLLLQVPTPSGRGARTGPT